MRKIDLEQKDFKKEAELLLFHINSVNEDGIIFELKNDLLNSAFSELLASELFAEMSRTRRKELFTQYLILSNLLSELINFFSVNE